MRWPHTARGHELGSKRPGWPYPSAEWVREAERLVALADRLPAVLKGEAEPGDAAERLALARCATTRRSMPPPPGSAARRWRPTRSWPTTAASAPLQRRLLRRPGRRRPGQGRPAARRRGAGGLREQALDWLRAELAAWRRLDRRPDRPRASRRRQLRHWKSDADLAGVRDEAALAACPRPERADWRALWAEVDRLLKAAGKAP